MIKDLILVNTDGKTLFDYGQEQYIVPLYQRDFAWGSEKYSNRENEIIQLMDDIMDVPLENNYYLGSLIVFKRPGQSCYEVIDGQQRLTALYLLFNCLGYTIEKQSALTYDCRPKSDNALKQIHELMKNGDSPDFDYNTNICIGIKTIQRKIEIEAKNDDQYIDKMKAAFMRVHLFRIEVPECTDLNRYFEIMNTRGEQLEQHDIVKAALMSKLDSSEKREIFAEIWNACSDMSGYIQMHFNPQRREQLFGNNWNACPGKEQLSFSTTNESKLVLSLNDIINPEFSVSQVDFVSDSNEHFRFESIIDFSYFLLHVLKVFVHYEEISNSSPENKLLDDLLDDKKLIWSFERVRNCGVKNGEKISENDFAWKFMIYLLRCRFFFDKYVIKREYNMKNSDGEWSLKELHVSKNGSQKKAYYKQTEFRGYYEREATTNCRKNYNKMIQACLRVSYTSPKSMHWITELLKWVNNDQNQVEKYHIFAQKLVADSVLDFVNLTNHQLGVNTPHIVFNFLDFLLWKQSYDRGCGENFDFEFRNSVEHWYPQNPTDKEGCPRWDTEDGHGTVDRFGNLALLPTSINSRFSNQSPQGKIGYESIIAKGSLKLRLMKDLTINSTQEEWRTTYCEKHEKEMLELLKNACQEIIGTE